jgi:two-component system CheB/CheR fusion protein
MGRAANGHQHPPNPEAEMTDLQPDHAEERFATQADDAIPARGFLMLPLVGLGGSAGSIPALQAFFRSMPADSGMAFVVVIHLSSTHESVLADLIQRTTAMRVVQVRATEKIEPNCVYVIPPGKLLEALDGELRLAEMPASNGRHVAVDLFFRTLADTYGPHATAIVLSGADGDGAIGIRRIKERGGLSIAQDPHEAEHSSMPRSSISTGAIDLVLPVAEMAARLVRYYRLEKQLVLPPEAEPDTAERPSKAASSDEVALRQVLALMQNRTGHDFSAYKRASVLRRLGRRMQVNEVETLPEYLELLRTRPGEARSLLKDLLVSVTNFFRDDRHFAALAAQLPALFEGKGPADTVRVWVAGCATGEEAYSIAILLHEHAERIERAPKLRVFASDLDADAIRVGRSGFYLSTIAADVSEERLERWFTREMRGYRVCPELRETVLFASHDLLKDSPFSRLDLVSCRNLLIYFDRNAQERSFEIFHFALRPDGLLFLGTSESAGELHPLFEVLDKKHCLFRRRASLRPRFVIPIGADGPMREAVEGEPDGIAVPAAVLPAVGLPADTLRVPGRHLPDLPTPSDRPSDLHFRLIERYSPPSLVVDSEYDIVHMSQRAGRFLRFGGGEPSRNLLRIAHPVLRIELRAALNQAAQTGKPAEVLNLPIDLGGVPLLLDISVAPADEIAPRCLLVVFNERRPDAPLPALGSPAHASTDSRVADLYDEVVRLKMQLRDVVEQQQASIEELQASNEELQAMNEDLRSASEELEARRQEAQSVNEELATVGVELRRTVEEVGASNSDLHNLMESMSIAMIFLDRERRITFYTPSAVSLFHLIPTDVGRPLADLAHALNYEGLADDASSVLHDLVPIEREVGDANGRWFLARLQPYLTLEDRITGVVLTFTDISERRRREVAFVAAQGVLDGRVEMLEATLAGLPDRVLAFDPQGRLLYANPEARRHWALGLDDCIGKRLSDLDAPADLVDVLERQLQRSISSTRRINGTVRYGRPVAAAATLGFLFSPVMGGDGRVRLVVGWLRDVVAPSEPPEPTIFA